MNASVQPHFDRETISAARPDTKSGQESLDFEQNNKDFHGFSWNFRFSSKFERGFLHDQQCDFDDQTLYQYLLPEICPFPLETPWYFLQLKTQSAIEKCEIQDFQFLQFWSMCTTLPMEMLEPVLFWGFHFGVQVLGGQFSDGWKDAHNKMRKR